MPLTYYRTVNITLPTNTVVLTFFSASCLLRHNSTDCILFSGLKWCTRLSYMVIILFINSSLRCSWCDTNCWPISNARTHLPAAHIYNYSQQSPTQNGCFVHYFLLRNITILFNESFNMTLVCLISCSSWTSAMLLLIHVQGDPLELSTTNRCGPMLNSTHVSTFFSTRNFHSQVKVNHRHVRTSFTARCSNHTDMLHSAKFISTIQSPLVAEV